MRVDPPGLTPGERAAAAARAVAARRLRAQVRAGLRDGSLTLADVLEMARREDDRSVARMRVADLVRSFPGIGPVRCAALMDRLGIAANRRVAGLGHHQAEALVAALSSRRPRRGGSVPQPGGGR